MPTPVAVPNPLAYYLSQCHAGWIAVGIFSMCINILMLTVSVYMLQIYDRVLPGRSLDTLIYLTLIACAALVVMGCFDLIRSRILVRIGVWLDRTLSPVLFERGVENSLRGTSYRSEALRDLSTLRNFLSGNGILILFDAPWVPIYLAVIFVLHPVLGWFSTAGAIVLFALTVLNNFLTMKRVRTIGAKSSKAYQTAEACFRNAEVIDGMGMAPALVQRWDAVNAALLGVQLKASDTAGLINATTKSMRMIMQMLILGIGAWLVLHQEMTAGGMIAASIIMARALAPVEMAVSGWHQTMAAQQAWKRLSDLLKLPSLHPPNISLPKPKGLLAVEDVVYTPPGAPLPALRGVSFALEPGEVLAILGPSAAGKSTLARLAVGLAQPERGSVRLDGADVFGWKREEFGHHVGYLPQDIELFSGTVHENIARMNGADSAQVIEAACIAGAHDMILRLPKGYETRIGEQGVVLSAGQRQRVGLARAVYRVPTLIVLDEPNSSLDVTGEQALGKAIMYLKSRKSTIVVVSHRPALVNQVDKILVLSEGQLQWLGPRSLVLDRQKSPKQIEAKRND
jgi:PrtD family type I secretion system ABC transporter